MILNIPKTAAQLVNVNPRRDLHGDKPEPAGDLRIAMDMPNDQLAMFHPNLRHFLFHYDNEIGGDLVDEAKRGDDPHYAPHLRMPKLAPLKWDDEIIGAKVTVHYGVRNGLELPTCNVNEFRIEPKAGGTVTISFRVQAHPDEKQFGKLCSLIGNSVEVSVESPTSEQADIEDGED